MAYKRKYIKRDLTFWGPDSADKPSPKDPQQDMSTVLSRLCSAVEAYYREKGDRTAAGVVVAYTSFEKAWYASVCRYPSGPGSKIIVSQSYCPTTLEQCIRTLAERWLALTTALEDTVNLREKLEKEVAKK